MAQKKINSDILKLVKRYKQMLEGNMQVDKVIIFGSQTKGTAKKYSDIDVCVVSPIFGKDRQGERVFLSRFVDTIDLRIEPHPYHPNDLNDGWDSLAHEILTHGVIVQ